MKSNKIVFQAITQEYVDIFNDSMKLQTSMNSMKLLLQKIHGILKIII